MPDVNPTQLALKLRELRGDKKLTKLQEESGIHRATWSKYENGIEVPGSEAIVKIANYYQIDKQLLLDLIYENSFPEGSPERNAILNWAKKVLENS